MSSVDKAWNALRQARLTSGARFPKGFWAADPSPDFRAGFAAAEKETANLAGSSQALIDRLRGGISTWAESHHDTIRSCPACRDLYSLIGGGTE